MKELSEKTIAKKPAGWIAGMLRLFNMWRRGKTNDPRMTAKELGFVIDRAIAILEKVDYKEIDNEND